MQRSLIFTGVLCRSYSKLDEAVVLPGMRVIGRHCQPLEGWSSTAGVKIPGWPDRWVEDPVLDASRFTAVRTGICLITQDMLDLAQGLIYEWKVLSPSPPKPIR